MKEKEMDTVKRLAKAILLAQEIREESFDEIKAEKNRNPYFDLSTCYGISEYEAADRASNQLGFDKRMTQPIYLLCKLAWNDAQDWAKAITKEK
jgi:hypothetical protein